MPEHLSGRGRSLSRRIPVCLSCCSKVGRGRGREGGREEGRKGKREGRKGKGEGEREVETVRGKEGRGKGVVYGWMDGRG